MNLFILLFLFYYCKFQGIRREIFLENLRKLKETIILVSKLANKRMLKSFSAWKLFPALRRFPPHQNLK